MKSHIIDSTAFIPGSFHIQLAKRACMLTKTPSTLLPEHLVFAVSLGKIFLNLLGTSMLEIVRINLYFQMKPPCFTENKRCEQTFHFNLWH